MTNAAFAQLGDEDRRFAITIVNAALALMDTLAQAQATLNRA